MSNDNFTISDLFGPNPARPDHPDFWKMSETVLGLDAAMQEGTMQGKEVDEVIAEVAAKVGDSYSIGYMAVQRAMRVIGIQTLREIQTNIELVSQLATIYLEGIIVGASLAEGKNANGQT